MTDIDTRIELLAQKKEDLRQLRAEVDYLDRELAAQLSTKAEGSVTLTRSKAKVTVTNKINRTVDQSAVIELKSQIPQDQFDLLFPVKYGLSKSAYDSLTDRQRLMISTAITAKPAKPSIKVELL